MPASSPTENLLGFFLFTNLDESRLDLSVRKSFLQTSHIMRKLWAAFQASHLKIYLPQCHNTRSPSKAPFFSACHITKHPTNPLSHLETLSLSQMGEVACYTPLCPECKRPCPGGGSSKEVKLKPSKKDGKRDGGPSK